MSGAKVGRLPNVRQNSRYAKVIGIHLHLWPGRIIREPGIFRLNAYETGIAGGHAFPDAFPCMIAPSGSDHIVGTVPTKAKLSKRAREVGAPLNESVQSWHVGAFPRRCSVVAYNTHYI